MRIHLVSSLRSFCVFIVFDRILSRNWVTVKIHFMWIILQSIHLTEAFVHIELQCKCIQTRKEQERLCVQPKRTLLQRQIFTGTCPEHVHNLYVWLIWILGPFGFLDRFYFSCWMYCWNIHFSPHNSQFIFPFCPIAPFLRLSALSPSDKHLCLSHILAALLLAVVPLITVKEALTHRFFKPLTTHTHTQSKHKHNTDLDSMTFPITQVSSHPMCLNSALGFVEGRWCCSATAELWSHCKLNIIPVAVNLTLTVIGWLVLGVDTYMITTSHVKSVEFKIYYHTQWGCLFNSL